MVTKTEVLNALSRHQGREHGISAKRLAEQLGMPIRPENRKRYPRDWREISARVRADAGNACEGSPAFPACRAKNHEPHPETGSIVVLTVGHLDHQPENCERANLRAWCQRCHLVYDRDHHAETAYRTRKAAACTADLFEEAR